MILALRQSLVTKCVLTIALCLSAPYLYSEIYKTVDKNGKVIFTDKKSPSAEKIKVRDPNTTTSVETKTRVAKTTSPKKSETYTEVKITSPKDQTVFPNGLVPFTVSASISPALSSDHKLALLIDGELYGKSSGNSFKVQSLSRGPHTLQLKIIDSSGLTIKQSSSINVQAYRPGGR